MSTLATLREEIRGVLLPSAVASSNSVPDSRINLAINDAIEDVSRKPYKLWFQGAQQIYTAVVNDPTLGTLPSDFGSVRNLNIPYNDLNYTVQQIDITTYDVWNDELTDIPAFYTFKDGSIQLVPYPDIAYTVQLRYYKKYAALVNDGDTNDWLTECKNAIKYYAVANLYREELKDFQQAQVYMSKFDEVYSDLIKESRRLTATGFLTTDDSFTGGYYGREYFNSR